MGVACERKHKGRGPQPAGLGVTTRGMGNVVPSTPKGMGNVAPPVRRGMGNVGGGGKQSKPREI